MDSMLLQLIFHGILILGVLGALGVIVFFLGRYLQALTDRNRNEIIHLDRAYEDRNKNITYSLELLDLIKTVTTQNTILMFRTFRDNHKQYDKVTLSNLAELASDVSKSTIRSLSAPNFSLNDTVLTEEFYTKYMIYTAMVYIKELHRQTLEGYDPEEFMNETRIS